MEKPNMTFYMENKADHARIAIYGYGNECEISYFDDDFAFCGTPCDEDEERYTTAEEERDYYLAKGFVELNLNKEEKAAFEKSFEDAFMR